jgi:serine/threonine protein kinase
MVLRPLSPEPPKGEAAAATSPAAKPPTVKKENLEATGAFAPPPPTQEDMQITGEFPPPPQTREDVETTGEFAPPPTQEDLEATGAFTGAAEKAPVAPVATRAEPAQKTKIDRKASRAIDIPERLGGYQVLQKLGEGGMGAVYLGRQIALDRHVALKVMNDQIANDPSFVARFTREAYAAAQLVHHNVVQVYDIGTEGALHFFSMEFVPGQTLSALIKKQGKLDPEVAVGYILQAARGLKFGHDLNIIHRDVKPDNLMVNDQGIVKLADLGLVKIGAEQKVEETVPGPHTPSKQFPGTDPGSSGDITIVGQAMGTPTYMAPEQARNAADVDHRSDIYSLGCTLYVLLTGRPPFEGKTVLEVLTKHASEPVIPPEVVVKRVPKALSAIVLKMMAKRPADRYSDLDEVIQALEGYLGVQTAGRFSPSEEHAQALENCVKRFNESFTAALRNYLILGFAGACVLLVLGCLVMGKLLWAAGFLSLGLITPFAYFVANGFLMKPPMFLRFRELVMGSRWFDWFLAVASIGFFCLILFAFGWFWAWLGFALAGVLLALALAFVCDRQVASDRQPAIDKAEKLFRTLRIQGLDEETLRQFVCKYSGRRWEEFFENLFGYEAKLTAREWSRGELGKGREKFAAWRDPIIVWLDRKLRSQREARQRKQLQAVEERALKAQGIEAAQARQRAELLARNMVAQGAELKQALARGDTRQLRGLFQAARRPADLSTLRDERSTADRLEGVLDGVLGPRLRFLAGVVLLAGCLLWVHQNQLISVKDVQKAAEGIDISKLTDLEKISEEAAKGTASLGVTEKETKPLDLPAVPAFITNRFDSFYPGVAGLVLLISSLFRGWKIGLALWPAALLIWAGDAFGLPSLGPLSGHVAGLVIGLGVAFAGLVLLREKR